MDADFLCQDLEAKLFKWFEGRLDATKIKRRSEMKVKTSELSRLALDLMVAKAKGIETSEYHEFNNEPYMPSVDWAQGGPIIEREKIDVMWGGDRWCAYTMTPDGETQLQTEGPTPLIAAMRGYVLSRLGVEVEVHHAPA